MHPNQRTPCWNHWRLTSPKFKSLPLERFPSPKERIVLQPFFFSCYESNFGKKRIQTNKITHKQSQIASVIPKKSGYPKQMGYPKTSHWTNKNQVIPKLILISWLDRILWRIGRFRSSSRNCARRGLEGWVLSRKPWHPKKNQHSSP